MLSIAEDFDPYPAGRVPADGDKNGQTFRENLLLPMLRDAIASGETVVVSLDGLKACGSSFLESAFGGLVRYEHFRKDDLARHLEIVNSHPSLDRYKMAIKRHIDKAIPEPV